MSDRHISINNFKYGLDSRKSELTSQPGVLAKCENAHINSGGEIEKRKAFVVDEVQFPVNTFGLQDTEDGLVTFTSSITPGPLPNGIIAQMLTLPAGANNLTRIRYSCNYLGKAFVIAEFDSGAVRMFYDGSAISEMDTGFVYNPAVLVQAGQLLVALRRFEGWKVTSNGDGTLIVESPGGVHFTPVIEEDSVSGQLGAKLIAQNQAATAAVAATVAFELDAGTDGTVEITAPANANGTGVANLTGGAIAFHISLAQTAQEVVDAINANSFLTGYSASVDAAKIIVYAPSTFGNVTFNLTVTTTNDITTAPAAVAPTFVAHASTNNLDVLVIFNKPRTVVGVISVSVTGASAPGSISYLWEETDANGTPLVAGVDTFSGIAISPSKTSPSANCSKPLNVNQSVQGYFRCTATDPVGPHIARVYVSVHLELDSNL